MRNKKRLILFLSIGLVLGSASYMIPSRAIEVAAPSLFYPQFSAFAASCDRSVVTRVTVLTAGRVSTEAPPGAVVNVLTKFRADSTLPHDYLLVLSLVDGQQEVVAQVNNNLNNKLLFLPASAWSGAVSITTSMNVPKVSNGTYYYLLELDGPSGAIALTPGPGVSQDKQCRYQVGELHVHASVAPPDLLPPPTLDLGQYNMTFDDEFTSLSISDSPVNDGSRWYSRNEECCMMTTDGTKAAMVGISSPHNPFSLLPAGGLNIRLQKASKQWTSGVLTSVDSHGKGFSQTYGYFEMKAKFPPGQNTWPAFWLLNAAAKSSRAPAGEIDIVEYIANPRFSDYISTTLHDWSRQTNLPMSHQRVTLPNNSFHTYGMLWTAETMTFYFDRSVTFQTPTPSIMHQPYYPIVDLGIGGGWPTEKTPATNDMKIQYIRAYQSRPLP